MNQKIDGKVKMRAGDVRRKGLSRTRRPSDMTLEEWQTALRREFGRGQKFKLKNLGTEPVFSEYGVTNPATQKAYRVAIRGCKPGDNYCTCPDFAVNTLGTCKHIEFTLARLERNRKARKELEAGYHSAYSEVFLRYGAKREVVFRAGSQCSDQLHNLTSKWFDKDGVLRRDVYSRFEDFLKQAGGCAQDLRCSEEAISFVAQVRDQEALARHVHELFGNGRNGSPFKKLVSANLYPYQREGACFAAAAGRSIIADDMGLGKTIQAITAAEILAKVAGIEKALIVSPTSLKHQWKQEIEKFSKRNADVVEGLRASRRDIYDRSSFYKITNYEVIHQDIDLIHKWAPDVIILDEAQRIKNWNTRRARSVKALKSDYAIVLTGTPIENRLEELYSIVEFADRFRLGPMFKFLAEHQHVDECGKVIGYRNLSKVSETLKNLLIRRTKDEVLKNLPERLEKRFFVPMSKEQMRHHEENRDIVAKIVAKWRRHGFLTDKDQRRMMMALQNMRMSCNSTFLIDKKTDDGVKTEELMKLLDDVLEQPDAKVVIFSQWVLTHNLIAKRLENRKHKFVFFHGGVESRKRKDLISRFKQDPSCRLFLSTDAGGVGLNLQHATVVVNMDLPWNPAVLEQRIGRVHRLGQQRPVLVVNFVAQGTIEHGMLDVLKFKKSMFTGVLDGGEDEVFLGGTRLKRFMESVEGVTDKIPTPMPVELSEEPEDKDGQDVVEDIDISDEPRYVSTPDVWSDVLSAGLSFLDKLAVVVAESRKPTAEGAKSTALTSMFERDAKTGRNYLKLPMPEPDTLNKIVDLLKTLANK